VIDTQQQLAEGQEAEKKFKKAVASSIRIW